MNFEGAHHIYGKIKVLHIDDDELQLKILKDNLEQINQDILIESEKEINSALKKIETHSYDCILLDYLMPIEDGIEVSRKIRTISKVPIILYTTQGIEGIDDNFFSIGINEYLRKDLSINNYSILENKILNLVKQFREQKLYIEILKKINDLVVIIDNDKNISYYNDNFSKFFGKSNLVGTNILNLFEGVYKDSFIDFIVDENIEEIESVMNNTEKVTYHVVVNKSKINNESYKFLSIKDVTNQVLKSDIKSSSDNRFNAISNMSPDGIMTLSMFGYVTYVNPSFSRLTGFSEEEIVGKHMLRIPTMEGRNLKPYLDLVKSFFSGKITRTSFEFPYSRKDGSSGIGLGYLNTIRVNGKRELIAIIKDVTDNKVKEEEYQHIFKSSPEGIIHLDLDGTIKNINESAIQLLEINSSEFIGKNIFEVLKELQDSKIDFNDLYSDVISNKKIDPFELEVKFDEDHKWFLVSVGLIKVYEENLGIQFLLRDITRQKESEKEKLKYTENLEQMVEERTNQILDNEKMVTLAKISSMITHDLKGPLQIISNSLHLIKLRPDEQEKYLDYISKAVEQSNDLIEEMQIHGKETPLKITLVNLEDIIEESLLQVKVTENINFETTVKFNKAIKLDKSKLIRVFNNMFKNAIEAMPDGGKIQVHVEEENTNVKIKIIDTGKGIPEEKMKNLFRPFQSTKAKGMGLGLNFCKNTIEAHRGSIAVESELGKGTTFTILLPIDKENYEFNPNHNIIKIKDTLIE